MIHAPEPKIFPYKQPINFKCSVNGKELQAVITAEVEQGFHHCFHIQFNDGYEDNFSYVEDGVVGNKERKSKVYASAIHDDIFAMLFYTDGVAIGNFSWTKIGGQNVWVIESMNKKVEDGLKRFAVYYKEDYRFELVGTKSNWNAKTIRVGDAEKIDSDLAAYVGLFIDTQLL